MYVSIEAGIVAQPAIERVQRAKEDEIFRAVRNSDVEKRHFMAGAAIALSNSHSGGDRRRGCSDMCRWEGKISDISCTTTMTGAMEWPSG